MNNIIKKGVQFLFPLFVVLFFVFLLPANKALALTITPVRLEISGDPGQTVNQQMTLINEFDTPETYYVSYANFEAQGESGTPSFVDATSDLGTWMSAPSSVTLNPKESKIIPITITIPKDADPGGHFAAIFWGTIPPKDVSNGVAIGAKTGMLVLLSVSGNVSEQGGILEFGTKNKQTFFTSLPINFYYRFQNSGGDRIKPTGNIIMKDILGLTGATIDGNPVQGNVLPASIRRFETVWQGKDGPTPPADSDQGNFFDKVGYEWNNFAFGHYNANISLAYGTKNEISTASFAFWVFPWHLTVFVLIALILVFFIGRFMIKRYNRWVIGQARTMLKREGMLKQDEEQDAHEGKNSRKKV